MIVFFKNNADKLIAVQFNGKLNDEDLPKLNWILASTKVSKERLTGFFVGPRKEMVSPWSTNAVEITQNMGINNIVRMEE
jgi:phosphoribosylformylglycinamidine synthase